MRPGEYHIADDRPQMPRLMRNRRKMPCATMCYNVLHFELQNPVLCNWQSVQNREAATAPCPRTYDLYWLSLLSLLSRGLSR